MTALQVYVCVAGRSVCGLFICESEREARVFIRNADVCVTHTHTHTWCMSLSMHEHRMCVYVPREGKKGEREFIRKSRQRACAYRWQASGAMAAWLEEMSKAVMTRDSSDTNAYSMVYLGSDERQVCTASARTLPSSMCHTLTHTSHVSVYARTSHVCLCT
jgi:hypothetical protein